MPTYTATFERIGRDRSASPITVEAADADGLAEAIYRHVNSRLLSVDVDVDVDLADGTGRIIAGGRPAGRFTITGPGAGPVGELQPRVPIGQFGADHWSTLAFVETRVVDHRGQLAHDQMRCDPGRHPAEFTAKRYGSDSPHADGSAYPTKIKDGELTDHDDYDCLTDLQAVGLLIRTSLSVCELTDRGRAVAADLRQHRAGGGNWHTFTLAEVPAAELSVGKDT